MGYNVKVNGIWYNGTTDAFKNVTTVPGGWANITVWAFNSSGKGSLSIGSVSQSIQIPIELTLIRTSNTPMNDSKTVNLSQGNYTVIINNTNLSELDMNVYDNGTIRTDLSQIFVFNNSSGYSAISYAPGTKSKSKTNYGSNNLSINLNIQKLLNVVFIPYGIKGTMCNVIIRKGA